MVEPPRNKQIHGMYGEPKTREVKQNTWRIEIREISEVCEVGRG
jgi:hypothetical protein